MPEYVADKISEFADDFFAGEAELVITKDEMDKGLAIMEKTLK